MGDFKTAFIEGFGKSLAYAIGGIIFLLLVALLGGTGLIGAHKAGLIGPKKSSGPVTY